jgi:hypothetical protein
MLPEPESNGLKTLLLKQDKTPTEAVNLKRENSAAFGLPESMPDAEQKALVTQD